MGDINWLERSVEVNNVDGLHVRPCTMIAQAAIQFSAELVVCKDSIEASAKEAMSLLLLEARPGDRLAVRAAGKDAKAALAEVCELVAYEYNMRE